VFDRHSPGGDPFLGQMARQTGRLDCEDGVDLVGQHLEVQSGPEADLDDGAVQAGSDLLSPRPKFRCAARPVDDAGQDPFAVEAHPDHRTVGRTVSPDSTLAAFVRPDLVAMGRPEGDQSDDDGIEDVLYGEHEIIFLEELWGDGFLSPGGPEEVARTVGDVDLSGKLVVDIGCGSGGVTIALVCDHGAGRVIGIDVEAPVCDQARARVERRGLSDRIEIRQVSPGPLPFGDASIDVVFSKDSIVHIPDKETLAVDVFRVLRPGGWFVASDWLIAHDDEPSPEMAAYIAAEDLDFGMASPRRYRAALEAAGFIDVELVNRNEWYREVARHELERLTGSQRGRFESLIGPVGLARQIATWTAMVPVLASGEHCPHHIRGRRPG